MAPASAQDAPPSAPSATDSAAEEGKIWSPARVRRTPSIEFKRNADVVVDGLVSDEIGGDPGQQRRRHARADRRRLGRSLQGQCQ
ncbi:hypothetical protein DdX_22037 [Ditylenchus destructor]|uniref:Uncharacterized protein n=1 Tax=Ditylenchus destructor TaxID=166010 RepID=A0AAD4MEW7_9BILA|nr:hypothetical protein DdX_22037 [Ditylenchus destructor]